MREKLIDIVEAYADFLDWDTKEDIVDAIMEKCFATDNNVGHKWIPVTERLPKPFTPVLVYRKSFGTLPPYIKVDKMILWNDDTQVWTDEIETWKTVVTHWMPLPEPPKGE